MITAGVDEAGRGALAGDVVVGAVILDPNQRIEGLKDSKQLSPERRKVMARLIKAKALAWAIGSASSREVDKHNVLKATLIAMKRAVNGLNITPDFIKVDGNALPYWSFMSECVPGGDRLVPCISAASIIAKEERDSRMIQLHQLYPVFGFQHHKGYGTREHMAAIKAHGVSPVHRCTYKPVREVLLKHVKERL